MAVEIFQKSASSEQVVRSYGSEATLGTGSDVYFGSAAPGIAYYEKAGSDLRVTLLDSQEIVLKNFFVVGPEGQASRLLLGAGGPVEVTGLLAPEPFIPENAVPTPDEPVTNAPAIETPHVTETVTNSTLETGSYTETGGPQVVAGSGSPTFFGHSLDKILFLAGSAPIVYSAFQDDDTSSTVATPDPDTTHDDSSVAPDDDTATNSGTPDPGATDSDPTSGDGTTPADSAAADPDTGTGTGTGTDTSDEAGTDGTGALQALYSEVISLLGLGASDDSAAESSLSGGIFDETAVDAGSIDSPETLSDLLSDLDETGV